MKSHTNFVAYNPSSFNFESVFEKDKQNFTYSVTEVQFGQDYYRHHDIGMTSVDADRLLKHLVHQPRRFLVKRNACGNSFRKRNQSYCNKKRFFNRKYRTKDKAGIGLEILVTHKFRMGYQSCAFLHMPRKSVESLTPQQGISEGEKCVQENLSKNIIQKQEYIVQLESESVERQDNNMETLASFVQVV